MKQYCSRCAFYNNGEEDGEMRCSHHNAPLTTEQVNIENRCNDFLYFQNNINDYGVLEFLCNLRDYCDRAEKCQLCPFYKCCFDAPKAMAYDDIVGGVFGIQSWANAK